MTGCGSRTTGSARLAYAVATVLGLVAALPAHAGPIVDRAADAQARLEAGDVAGAAAALDAAYDAFAAAAPLALKTAVLADRIGGYGDYAARAPGRFRTGDRVHIYAEPVGAAGTSLRPSIEIRDGRGLIYARATELPPVAAPAGAAGRVFHVAVGFTLPALRPGDYTLVLTLAEGEGGEGEGGGTVAAELPMTVAP